MRGEDRNIAHEENDVLYLWFLPKLPKPSVPAMQCHGFLGDEEDLRVKQIRRRLEEIDKSLQKKYEDLRKAINFKPPYMVARAIVDILARDTGISDALLYPGYLSRGDGVGRFYDRFGEMCTMRKAAFPNIALMGGMSGADSAAYRANIERLEKDGHLAGGYAGQIAGAAGQDHSKVWFLYSFDDVVEEDSRSVTGLEGFLASITVHAVIVGSSNVSDSTYFGGRDERFTYGEMDVALIACSESCEDAVSQEEYLSSEELLARYLGLSGGEADRVLAEYGLTLFSKVYHIGGSSPHRYLKSMLEQKMKSLQSSQR